MKMLPNFVIIGAQKSASSFLQSCLSDHPDCFLPKGETPFFESPDYENSNINDLESQFEERNEKCLGIKRPNYIGKPEVPERILYHLPNAKLIAVLRNPIDRAISAYYHYIKDGFIPPKNVEIGMRKILNDSSFLQKYKRSSEIIEFGYYYKYLLLYNNYYQNNQLLFFLHDDILQNPLNCIQKAYQFLDLDYSFVPLSLNSRPQKVMYNLSRLKVLSYRNNFMYTYNENKTRLFPKKMSKHDKMIVKIINKIDTVILKKILPNRKPNVSYELRRELYQIYKDDIKSLENLIGRNLDIWKPE